MCGFLQVEKETEGCLPVIEVYQKGIERKQCLSPDTLLYCCNDPDMHPWDVIDTTTFPTLSKMELFKFLYESEYSFLRVCQGCVLASFSRLKIIIFSGRLLILKYEPLFLSYVESYQNKSYQTVLQGNKSTYMHMAFSLFLASCEESIRVLQLGVDEEQKIKGKRTIYARLVEIRRYKKEAVLLEEDIKVFRSGISALYQFLLQRPKSREHNSSKVVNFCVHCNNTVSVLLNCLQESFYLHQHCSMIVQKLRDMEEEYQTQVGKQQTSVLAHNLFGNIIIAAVLIGATSGNSFGSNLNIPPYHSTKGIDGYLWYIVVFCSFAIWFSFLTLFLLKNKPLIRYLRCLYKK